MLDIELPHLRNGRHFPASFAYPGIPNTPESHGADGGADDTVALRKCFAAGGNIVFRPGRTYIIDEALTITANTTLWLYGATIKAKNSATWNSGPLLYIGGSNVSIFGGILDGNRANNPSVHTNFAGLVYIGYPPVAPDDVTIADVTFQNCAAAITGYDGLRTHIFDCKFFGVNFVAIGISRTTADQGNARHIISGNTFLDVGMHPILLVKCDNCSIIDNHIRGNLVTGLVLNTNGTAITLTTGVTTDMVVGNYLIANGGGEYFISGIIDSTHFTITTDVGVNVGWLGAVGTGDLLNSEDGNVNIFARNNIVYGAGGGIVVWANAAGNRERNMIVNNIVQDTGGATIALQTATGNLIGTSIIGNTCVNGSRDGAAAATAYLGGIALVGGAKISRLFIDGNTIYDNQGSPTTLYPVILGSIAAGEASFGRNYFQGTVNKGIDGAISITIGAGWGATAAVSLIESIGTRYSFRITAAGGGYAQPTATISVTTYGTSPEDPPKPVCMMVNANAAALAQMLTTSATRVGQIFVCMALPAAGTYDFIVDM